MKLISRRVFGVAVEEVAGDQAGFTDSIEELIAALARGLLIGSP